MHGARIGRTLQCTLLATLIAAAGWFLIVRNASVGGCLATVGTNQFENCFPRVEQSAPALTVAPITYRPVSRTIEAVGTLAGCEEVSICATAEGRVVKLNHDVSDHVRPGDELLQVDPIDCQLAVREAEKALLVELAKVGLQSPPTAKFNVEALPMVVEAKVKADNCKSHLERAEVLLVHKAVTEEEMLDKRVEYRMAEAEYENQISLAKASLATIQVKQEALAIAEQRLAETVVKAPPADESVPGGSRAVYAVSRRSVSEGSYAHPGMEIYRLVIDNTLKLKVPVPDSRSGEVRDGESVQVSVGGSARPITGAVARINPTVDPATHTFEVEVQIPNADGFLKVGGVANATILTRVDHDAATVPPDAPLTSGGVTKLLLADGQHITAVAVTLGAKSADWVEVIHPTLPRGARVVTSGQLAFVAASSRR